MCLDLDRKSPTNISKSVSHLLEVCFDSEILSLVDVEMKVCGETGLYTVVQSSTAGLKSQCYVKFMFCSYRFVCHYRL